MGSGEIATKLLEYQVRPIFIINNYKMLVLNILNTNIINQTSEVKQFMEKADGFILCNPMTEKFEFNDKPTVNVNNIDTCFAEIAKKIIDEKQSIAK